LTTDIDREGEGVQVKIWCEKNPTRKKRTEKFIQNELEEGYRTMKDPSKEDTKTLTDFALSSAASHGDSFFHGNEVTPVKELGTRSWKLIKTFLFGLALGLRHWKLRLSDSDAWKW
jgi:hypothetical protein